jgi:hypothetical protein
MTFVAHLVASLLGRLALKRIFAVYVLGSVAVMCLSVNFEDNVGWILITGES